MTIRSAVILRGRKVTVSIMRPTTTKVDFELVTTLVANGTSFGHSQPLQDTDVKYLEDGQDTSDFRVWHTSDTLQTPDDKRGEAGDELHNHLGFNWRIIKQKMWGDGTRHNRYIMQKIARYEP